MNAYFNSSLSKAHQLERKATALVLKMKYTEAIDCYKEAISYLTDSLTISNRKDVCESIKMQREGFERQIRLIQIRRENITKLKQRAEKEKNLQMKIFKTIDTHDSLIESLYQKGGSQYDSSTYDSDIVSISETFGSKLPKNDAMIIEELRVLSGQLKESVQELLLQLDDRNQDIVKLKTRIEELELEKSFVESDSSKLSASVNSKALNLLLREDSDESQSRSSISPDLTHTNLG